MENERRIERKEEMTMEKIASFTIDHIKLQPGVYVSRKDKVGDSTVTTFDLRMTSPNEEPVLNTAEMHTIEHLGATFLRNHKEFGDKTVSVSYTHLDVYKRQHQISGRPAYCHGHRNPRNGFRQRHFP